MKKWFDISQPLHNEIAVWPGDTPFSYEVEYTKEQTGSVNIGKVTMSMHTGTHIDAPFHFENDGKRVIDLDINVYIGKAMVVDVSTHNAIDAALLANIDFQQCKTLLLKTVSNRSQTVFPNWIPLLSEDIGALLKEKGITLLGVDIPSVDPLDSKELVTHHALFEHGVHILENIVLTNVQPGMYELIALPLPFVEGDGSPVRAVLREC
ncbi:MAG: arylformamidase [Bacillaceae bacterium]